MADYLMPSLGADMTEGRVVEWLVRPGDTVRRGAVVGVVDTAKGAIEIEIWEDGVVREIVVGPGAKVPVGEVLFRYDRGEGAGEGAEVSRAEPEPTISGARGEAKAAEGVEGGAPPARAVSERELVAPPREPPAEGARASPAARQRARELGVDLRAVRGSGPGGAVVLEDVLRAAERAAEPSAEPAASPTGAAEAMREAIAAAMSRSKREIPHYYLDNAVSMLRATEWLAEQNRERAPGARLLSVALILKAVALAARDFPEMNGHWADGGFRPSDRVHPGLAISLRSGGLIAPAVHDADLKTLDELTAAVTDLVQRARAGRLRGSEVTDATLTVSSLGDRGVDRLYGVIYPPQVALVGVGRTRDRAWAADGALGVRPVVEITLSGDHRVSDGHRGALFLERIGDLLQGPEEL
jgi:pyruvate dehydrogenase E2 component (dihydrolipoamide acetyltransferase)